VSTSASPAGGVCAFVLTRNRKALLLECLEALRSQTHPVKQIIVLDNASTDGTEEALRRERVLDWPELSFHRSAENTGGAGGFARGVALGVEAHREWIWLMDDDAEPRPDALARLVSAPAAQDLAVAALCSSVVHPDGEIDVQHRCQMGRFIRPMGLEAYEPGQYRRVQCASFVGFMIRTSVARSIALPRAEFFIAYDDAEYSLRVRALGDIRLVPESVLVHKLAVGGGSATRRSRFWNRVLGLNYTSVPWEAFWKQLYALRNFMWIKHQHGEVGSLAFAGLTLTYVLKSLLYDAGPLRRVIWIIRYALRGRRGDFSGPTPEDWRQIAAAG